MQSILQTTLIVVLLLAGCVVPVDPPTESDDPSTGTSSTMFTLETTQPVETTTATTEASDATSTTQPTTTATSTPPPAPPVPVVRVTSDFVRRYQNGTVWSPPYPNYHGCPDDFTIDPPNRRVLIHDRSPETTSTSSTDDRYRSYSRNATEAADAALSIQVRDPGAYYRNNYLQLPPLLPNTTRFALGNVQWVNVTLSVDLGSVRVNQTNVPMGQTLEFPYDYKWRRSDGQVLNVHETMRVQYLGDWVKPFGTVRTGMCI